MVDWAQLRLGARLGEGASGHIYQAQVIGDATQALALKLFKGSVTSDGLPEHELAACLTAGQHPALCTPVAELQGHPDGTPGLLLPLIPPTHINLAGPPSLDSCTRDVYASGLKIAMPLVQKLALSIAQALTHLHVHGVMHGDLYAHNILWNTGTGDAVLSDFGAATLLPAGDAVTCRQLQSLEVRAFGCLLEELLEHSDVQTSARGEKLRTVALACLDTQPSARPEATDVLAQIAAA
jgi:serine/threonine protein kinase